MNNSTYQATLSIAEDNQPDTTQYITFELFGYLFGLPSREILRVVTTPPPTQGGLVAMGMVQLGPYSIQIIDLVAILALRSTDIKKHPRPSVSSSRSLENRKKGHEPNHDENPPFLVVLENPQQHETQGQAQSQINSQELWGIALHEPPDLIEVPNYALKPVPSHQRQSQALQWVSHIVNYDLNEDRHTLLVLNLSPIVKRTRPPLHLSDSLKFTPIPPPSQGLRT
ncbi:MAG: hypothetical protein AAF810_19115 [Cyanobacteria bacterium P01_D01_bin.36]